MFQQCLCSLIPLCAKANQCTSAIIMETVPLIKSKWHLTATLCICDDSRGGDKKYNAVEIPSFISCERKRKKAAGFCDELRRASPRENPRISVTVDALCKMCTTDCKTFFRDGINPRGIKWQWCSQETEPSKVKGLFCLEILEVFVQSADYWRGGTMKVTKLVKTLKLRSWPTFVKAEVKGK